MTGRRVSIDGAFDRIPNRRHALPFIEQHRRRSPQKGIWIGHSQSLFGGAVTAANGGRQAQSRLRLPHSFGALKSEGRNRRQQFCKLGVDDSWGIGFQCLFAD